MKKELTAREFADYLIDQIEGGRIIFRHFLKKSNSYMGSDPDNEVYFADIYVHSSPRGAPSYSMSLWYDGIAVDIDDVEQEDLARIAKAAVASYHNWNLSKRIEECPRFWRLK